MIKKIVTRFPNLECGFFGALISIPGVQEGLGITSGENLSWEFISTNSNGRRIQEEAGVVHFNVGGGKWDQHGRGSQKSLCEICSLDLVRADYDFLQERPWLKEVYRLVRENDLRGARISRHLYNLRELMTGLTVRYPENPNLVLQWLTVAFYSVFAMCSAGVNIKKAFNPKEMIEGVEACSPFLLDWFRGLLEEGRETIDQEWEKAIAAVRQAESHSAVYVPAVNGEVRIIGVCSDSAKAAAAARKAGYNIAIQHNADGHTQVHGGDVKNGQSRLKLDLGPMARELRFWEAKFRRVRIASGQNWEASGFVIGTDGNAIPWLLPGYRTSIYNGTLGSKDVQVTKFQPGKLLKVVCEALPLCKCLPDERKEE